MAYRMEEVEAELERLAVEIAEVAPHLSSLRERQRHLQAYKASQASATVRAQHARDEAIRQEAAAAGGKYGSMRRLAAKHEIKERHLYRILKGPILKPIPPPTPPQRPVHPNPEPSAMTAEPASMAETKIASPRPRRSKRKPDTVAPQDPSPDLFAASEVPLPTMAHPRQPATRLR